MTNQLYINKINKKARCMYLCVMFSSQHLNKCLTYKVFYLYRGFKTNNTQAQAYIYIYTNVFNERETPMIKIYTYMYIILKGLSTLSCKSLHQCIQHIASETLT